MTVCDVIDACEYTGCEVYNQLGEKYDYKNEIEYIKKLYNKEVEHLSVIDGKIAIWTFDKL